jgi:hypothetical protein
MTNVPTPEAATMVLFRENELVLVKMAARFLEVDEAGQGGICMVKWTTT